jgi:hypothetical protein
MADLHAVLADRHVQIIRLWVMGAAEYCVAARWREQPGQLVKAHEQSSSVQVADSSLAAKVLTAERAPFSGRWVTASAKLWPQPSASTRSTSQPWQA